MLLGFGFWCSGFGYLAILGLRFGWFDLRWVYGLFPLSGKLLVLGFPSGFGFCVG